MIEAGFPLLGTAFVVLVVLPAFALIAKVVLFALERATITGRINRRFWLLTGINVLPLAWLFSAGLHQVESGETALSCLFEHDVTWCLEPGLFALALIVVTVCSSLRVIRSQRLARSGVGAECQMPTRVALLLASRPSLSILRDRLVVTDEPGFTLGTQGFFKPRVYLGQDFASKLTDEMLASALAHELQHVTALDPLRYAVLQFALGMNPVGRFLLEPHAAKWRAAREALCDREAVLNGAAPLSLAEAIVRAARPHTPQEAPALGARDTAVLKVRIDMLCALAGGEKAHCCAHRPLTFPIAVLSLVLALLLPHQTGTEALDVLHASTEHAMLFVWP